VGVRACPGHRGRRVALAAHEGSCTVVHLARFRSARRGADALVGLLHGSGIVLRVVVEVKTDGEPVIVAVVTRRTPAVVRALPRSIDGIEVVTRGVESKRKAP
jgi:hypothetical protein